MHFRDDTSKRSLVELVSVGGATDVWHLGAKGLVQYACGMDLETI